MVGKNQITEAERIGNQWKSIYLLGGVTALIVVFASLLDIVISILLGGDPSTIPQTAVGRFAQFQSNRLLGLYYLDLLNMTTAIIMIPAFFALFAAHRRVNKVYSGLAMIISFIGTAVFISNNSALSMLSLSDKYALAVTDTEKNLLAAAGEAMLARGAHGSPGVFPGFILPIIASLIMSIVMLKGGVFSKITAFPGIAGSVLFIFYFVLVTFIPGTENIGMALAIPGGLLTTVWMILFAIRLLKLRTLEIDGIIVKN
ncbi:MAG: DUF4386 family protein [Eubacteriales bacterium]